MLIVSMLWGSSKRSVNRDSMLTSKHETHIAPWFSSLRDTDLHVSTQMVLFEKAQFSGQVYEVHRDVADATALQLSPLISAKVVRGW